MSEIVFDNISRNYKVSIKNSSYLRYLMRREYKVIEAVKGVSFGISHGEAVGMIGPNGAGKSTTMKMMTGILVPSSGQAAVFGKDPFMHRKEICREIGVLFGQKSQLWWDLPAEDTFELLKKIYRIPDKTYEKNIRKYAEVLDTYRFLGQPVRQLSLGQRMRLELMACLLHDPKILFLDEPTLGLDVVVKRQIRVLLQGLKGSTTIILTSHDMKDIDSVCERLIVIDNGLKIVDNDIDEVKRTYGNIERVKIKIKEEDNVKLDFFPETVKTEYKDQSIFCSYNPKEISSADILQQVLGHYNVLDISIMSADIDDIIESIYRSEKDEKYV